MRKLLFAVVSAALLTSVGDSAGLLVAAPPNSSPKSGFKTDFFKGLHFRNIGPSRGGRVTTVTGIADQPSTFYMGATGGGVWKTSDYGRNWVNVSDGFFSTGSIGAIQVADSDPAIVYVGTGSDAIRSNVIAGRGVYKSTDSGKSWRFVGLRRAGQIGAVEIHPQNPDLVYVAAIGNAFAPNPERGVFRSRDGGKSWEKVLYLSETVGAVDLELCPDNPRTIYAAMWHGQRKPWTIISGAREGGIYKSIDGGDSWVRLTNGLPNGLVGKSDLAVSMADPDRLYVLMEAAAGEGGVYRSDDRGAAFRLVSQQASLLDRPFYYTNIDADPTDADVVFVNSTGFYQSVDGGLKWRRRSTPHGDNHDMWINPTNSDIFIQSNDGGANVTLDGGKSWSTQFNQPTAELYQVNVDDRFPYWVYAGQQDSSTIRVPSFPPFSTPAGPTAHWQSIGGCETGPAVPKPGKPNIVYSNCKGRFGRFNLETGQEKQYYVGAANMYGHNPNQLTYRFQRVSPIQVSPHDPNVVYHASQYLHRTTDEGVTWETISPDLTANDPSKQVISGSPLTRDITGEEFYSTIYAVQESPLEKGLIWVGANDGPVHVTRDGGVHWMRVTPKDLPSGGRVQTIEPSPHRAEKAYIAVYRYLLGDWNPYIYRTNDYGQSWTRLTTGDNGIPADYPTRAVREDPDREGLLYAGTEFGLFVSFDDGERWQPFQLNLPVTPVTDIKVYRKDLVLSTMGRAFWILDDLTPLHQMSEEIARADNHLFVPRDAYRIRYRTFRRSRGVPEYPPTGAMIDYWMTGVGSRETKLEILDSAGHLIRSFTSRGPMKGVTLEDGDGLSSHLVGAGTPKLPTGAGMHRFVWDLRYPGAWHSDRRRSGRGGPMVEPGTYQARLTVGNWSRSEPFDVLVDPRVFRDGVTQADLEAQVALSRDVRDALSEARRAASRIARRREALKKSGINGQARTLDRKLAAIESELVTAPGRYPTPMLIDQLGYLFSMLNRADQKPGRDAYRRLEQLKGQLASHLRELKQNGI